MWARIEHGVIQEVYTHRPMRGEDVPVRVRTAAEDDALLSRVAELEAQMAEADKLVDPLSEQVVMWRELAERMASEDCRPDQWLADLRAARDGNGNGG